MTQRNLVATAALASAILLARPVIALNDVERCQVAKLTASAKYDLCRLLAASRAVRIGGAPDYSRCDSKYALKWSTTEARYGGACPSTGDQTAMQNFVVEHADDVTTSVTTGSLLPNCTGDLTTCNSNLGTCNGSLMSCNGSLSTCSANLTSATASLTTCTSNLGTANASLASCNATVATCNAGTAELGDVLSGKTFSSSAGVGVTGTMANVGQQNVTPGTSPVTITQGYHNGTGTVAGDADLVAANVVSDVNLFGVAGTALPAQRLKTGQTLCYNNAGTVIACAGTGQDGELQRGVARQYVDNGDGTVTDSKTGLMWEKLSDDDSIHDRDDFYTWDNAFATKVATLNSGSFATYTDWRLPNVNELQSLANYGAVNPSVDAAFNTACAPACTVTTCSCTQSGGYWSSTTYQSNPQIAWYVRFVDGVVFTLSEAGNLYVRAVRGGS